MPANGSVRPLQVTDAGQVRKLFRATAAAGRPLWLPETDLVAYESLCLDYYLVEEGSACAVHQQDGVVTGYAMVALDHGAYQRWARSRALRWAGRALARMAMGPRTSSALFHRRRLLDGLVTLARGLPAPMPAHFHFNVDSRRRGGGVGFALARHADDVVAGAGLPGYFGEINVTRSKPGRERALERLGTRVVHRQRNHTLSWLAGESVDRLTVVRTLDPSQGWSPLPRRHTDPAAPPRVAGWQ